MFQKKLLKQTQRNIIINQFLVVEWNQENQKNKNKSKDNIMKDITNLLNQKLILQSNPVRVGNFHSNNYKEYESNDDRNKTLSIKECHDKIREIFERHYK